MPTDISEKELETILVSYLRDHQGYEEGVSSDYNKEFGLNTERVIIRKSKCSRISKRKVHFTKRKV